MKPKRPKPSSDEPAPAPSATVPAQSSTPETDPKATDSE